MEDNKGFDNSFREGMEDFQINPPARAWNTINGELLKKKAGFQKQEAIRFKRLSVVLALFLILFISFHYLLPSYNSNQSQLLNNKRLSSGKHVSGISYKEESVETKTKTSNSNSNVTNYRSTIKDSPDKAFNYKKYSSRIISTHTRNYPGKLVIALKSKSQIKKQRLIIENQEPVSPFTSVANMNGQATVINNSEQQDFDENNSPEPIAIQSLQEQNVIVKPLEEPVIKEQGAQNQFQKDSLLNLQSHIESPWSITAFYSPSYSKNHLTDNHKVVHNEGEEYYDNEKTNYSYATGLALGFDLNNQLTFTLGLSYSTISYTITLPKIYARHGFDNELHYQYPTSCGIIQIPDFGTSSLKDGDSLITTMNCKQKVEFLNIPLTIRYKISGNHFSYFADAGVALNYVIREHAKLNIGNTERNITNNIDGLKKMNYGYLAGIGLQYNLSKDFGIYIEPVFKGSINSLTEKTPENCYPYSFGLNAGMTYHF